MAEKASSVIALMKKRIKRTGEGKQDLFYVKADAKRRIRFLKDAEDALKVVIHDKYGEYNTPCLEYFGKSCPYCDRDDGRTRDNFAWPIYDYEDKRQKLFIYKANENTPIPHIIAMYETYGTILDRDYVVQRNGSGLDTSYTLIPMEKGKFKLSKKVKPWTKEEIFKSLQRAFAIDAEDDEDEEDSDDVPWDDDDEDDDDTDVDDVDDDDEDDTNDDENDEDGLDDDDFFDDDDDDDEKDLESMSLKELMDLAKKRKVKISSQFKQLVKKNKKEAKKKLIQKLS